MYGVKRWIFVGVIPTFEAIKLEISVWFNSTVNMNVVWMAKVG